MKIINFLKLVMQHDEVDIVIGWAMILTKYAYFSWIWKPNIDNVERHCEKFQLILIIIMYAQ